MKINRKPIELTQEQLRKLQLTELEMLVEFDRICRKNNIHYILGYGTLLGAVRHNGFIPWDDDVDVFLMRDEYNKFCEACKTDLNTEKFFLQNWETDKNFNSGYAKLRRNDTQYVRVGQERMKYHNGIYIDIMVFDKVIDKVKMREKFKKKCIIYRKLLYSTAGSMCEKNIFKRIGYKILTLIPKEKVKQKFGEYSQKYNDMNTCFVFSTATLGNQHYCIKLFQKTKEAEFEGHKFVVEELTENSFEGVEVAFWSAGGSISEKYMKYAVEAGCVNIDNTSHFRMDPNVPLVVPEVNGEALKDHHGIISCPNCTTIMMCSALTRLNDEFDIERIVVSTYQAVSGAGVAGMEELYRQSQEVLDGKEPVAKTLPCAGDKKHFPIAFNCIPQVDKFDLSNGYSKEEMKMVNETKKIFNKDIEVNATCVRVPVLRGHSESIYIETKKPIDMDKVFELLGNSTGIDLCDDLANQVYPMPTSFIGDELTHVGRVRKDLYKDNALSLWITGDQLMKGAAYNSVDIGLKMIELGLLK